MGKWCNWCFTPMVLPTIYDETLSYAEQLNKVLYHMQELTKFVNKSMEKLNEVTTNIDDYVDSAVEESVTKNIAEVNTKIDTLNNDITVLKDEIENLYNEIENIDLDTLEKELKEYTDNGIEHVLDMTTLSISTAVNELNDKIAKLNLETQKLITLAENRCNHYTDIKVRTLEITINKKFEQIEDKISDIAKILPPVFNPIRGKKTDIEQAILDLYQNLRAVGITAIRYDECELSAEQYDNMGLTAIEYDVYAGYLLNWWDDSMFSPFTGKKQSVKKTVNEIANYIKYNAKTAQEYDSLNFTAAQFDDSVFNAWEQDSNKQYKDVVNDYLNNFVKVRELIFSFENLELQNSASVTSDLFKNLHEIEVVVKQGDSFVLLDCSVDNNYNITLDCGYVKKAENTSEKTEIFDRYLTIDTRTGLMDIEDCFNSEDAMVNSECIIVKIYATKKVLDIKGGLYHE